MVSVLAEACGDRLEALAVQLVPVLLKAIAMGIQVSRHKGVADLLAEVEGLLY